MMGRDLNDKLSELDQTNEYLRDRAKAITRLEDELRMRNETSVELQETVNMLKREARNFKEDYHAVELRLREQDVAMSRLQREFQDLEGAVLCSVFVWFHVEAGDPPPPIHSFLSLSSRIVRSPHPLCAESLNRSEDMNLRLRAELQQLEENKDEQQGISRRTADVREIGCSLFFAQASHVHACIQTGISVHLHVQFVYPFVHSCTMTSTHHTFTHTFVHASIRTHVPACIPIDINTIMQYSSAVLQYADALVLFFTRFFTQFFPMCFHC